MPEYWAVLLELLRKLPQHTRFIVLCSEENIRLRTAEFLRSNGFFDYQEAFTHARGTALPRCLLLSPAYYQQEHRFTRWVRDVFICRWDQKHRVVQISEINNQGKAVAVNLTETSGAIPQIIRAGDYTDLKLMGGNLLLDSDFMLVGYKELHSAWGDQLPDALKKIESRLLKHLNEQTEKPFREVIFIGKTALEKIRILVTSIRDWLHPQQSPEQSDNGLFNHLDMFLTITGTNSAAGKPRLVLARAADLFTLGPADPKAIGILEKINAIFDAFQEELQENFEVIRNPIPVFIDYQSKSESGLHYTPPDRLYLGSYNNCLLENGKSQRIWLPQISISKEHALHGKRLQEIELKNKLLWEKLGFQVTFIEANFHPFLRMHGGLHCMTLELGRG